MQDGKLVQQKSGPFGSLKDAQAAQEPGQVSLHAGNDPSGRAKPFNPCLLQRVRETLLCATRMHAILPDFCDSPSILIACLSQGGILADYVIETIRRKDTHDMCMYV